jgi:DNA-binding transcriptional ArsR family regulator
MVRVKTTEVSSRLGNFTIIKLGRTVLISPCDTRMKILAALAEEELTAEGLQQETGLSYSAVMDHMELLERLGVVGTSLKKDEDGGRRRICFSLKEDPLEGIEELFVSKRAGKVRS